MVEDLIDSKAAAGNLDIKAGDKTYERIMRAVVATISPTARGCDSKYLHFI